MATDCTIADDQSNLETESFQDTDRKDGSTIMYLPLDHLIMPLPPPPTFAQQQQQHTNTLHDNRQNGTSILVLGSVIVALVAGIFALQLNSTILYGDFVGLNLGVLIGLIIGFVLGIFITNLYSFL